MSGRASTTARAFWMRILMALASVGRSLASRGGGALGAMSAATEEPAGAGAGPAEGGCAWGAPLPAALGGLFWPLEALAVEGCCCCCCCDAAGAVDDGPEGAGPAPAAPDESPGAAAAVAWADDSRRRIRACSGGRMSKICGGGKGTARGGAGVALAGVSGAEEPLRRGVAAVGDLEAMADVREALRC